MEFRPLEGDSKERDGGAGRREEEGDEEQHEPDSEGGPHEYRLFSWTQNINYSLRPTKDASGLSKLCLRFVKI